MVISKRQERILNIFTKTNKVLTSEEICTTLEVSSRTIRSDVKELNYFLDSNGARIVSEQGKGYKLKINECEKFSLFLSNIRKEEAVGINLSIEDRIKYILVKVLESELNDKSGVTEKSIADELFVSISTLKSDIKVLKEWLYQYNIKIRNVSKKGIKIVGNEEDLREIIYKSLFIGRKNYIDNKYLKGNNLCDLEVKEINELLIEPHKCLKKIFYNIYIEYYYDKKLPTIREIVKNAINEYNLRVTDLAYERIICYLAILIVRILKGKNIIYSRKIIEKFKKQEIYNISMNICKEIEDEYKINISESEVIHIVKCLSVVGIMNIEEEVNKSDILIINKILLRINEKFGVNITNDKMLKNYLANHLKAAINRAKYGINIENNMLTEIKSKFPFSFELSVFTNSIIINEIGINLNENDIGFIALHFKAALERVKYRNDKSAKRVLLVCTYGIGTALFLKTELEKTLNEKIIITKILPLYQLEKSRVDDADIIITTVPLKINTKKVILIKNVFDVEELKVVKNIIENENVREGYLLNKFKENLYFRNINGSNKKEVLDNIIKRVEDLEYISLNIRREILKREELSTTEIGNLTAIPCILHSEVKESFISISILKKPILWCKKNVQVVLLIAINNYDKNELKLCLDRVYNSILNDSLIVKILKSKNYKEFKSNIDKI